MNVKSARAVGITEAAAVLAALALAGAVVLVLTGQSAAPGVQFGAPLPAAPQQAAPLMPAAADPADPAAPVPVADFSGLLAVFAEMAALPPRPQITNISVSFSPF